MKKAGGIFILVGIAIFIFFIFAKGKTYYEQKKLTDEYTSLKFTEETKTDQQQLVKIKNGDPIGILEIPKIELNTPIVEGASPKDIQYAVGHLPSSSSIKDLGKINQNFAIAGHRSYTFGKFFNRLDELEKGDKIIVNVQDKAYTYTVFDKKIVDPTDVEVINPIKDRSVVTLITCHPMYSDKHRLIIFASFESVKGVK
jgi:sortase A